METYKTIHNTEHSNQQTKTILCGLM